MKRDRTRKKADPEPSTAELLSCMDYLHGDVVDKEYEAACFYEYAKESKTLREVARLTKEDPSAPVERICRRLERETDCGSWFIQYPWSDIWECAGFPGKSWNQLPEAQRREILRTFPSLEILPLRMHEATTHAGMGTFDELKKMAAQATEERKKRLRQPSPENDVQPLPKVYPIVDKQQWLHALFTLNFAKTKKRLRQEFEKWLDLPDNKKRLAAFKDNRIGKTGTFKDRLKDLAAWRLHRELGCEAALDFADENRKHDKAGRPRSFHDPRQGQSKKTPLNQAALYSEESGFLKAKARAVAYLAELMPREFVEMPEAEDGFTAFLCNAIKAGKISTSSSETP